MRATIDIPAEEYLQEIERMSRERANLQKFPPSECALCGSTDNIGSVEVSTMKLDGPKEIPVCGVCGIHLGTSTVEDFLRMVKENEFFLWTKIVAHHIRKDSWISRLAFEIMRE
ncbi:MAG: hypothetical protein JW939_04240 [Candidatus Thermoplasmatota archaeon]|nr:hypothetical protein [Candidatus Thermoplasmatota archaeon]